MQDQGDRQLHFEGWVLCCLVLEVVVQETVAPAAVLWQGRGPEEPREQVNDPL